MTNTRDETTLSETSRALQDLRRQNALLVQQNESLRQQIRQCEDEIARLTGGLVPAATTDPPPPAPRRARRWFGRGQ